MNVVLCNNKRDAHSIFKHIYIQRKTHNQIGKNAKIDDGIFGYNTEYRKYTHSKLNSNIIQNDLTRKSEKVKIHEFIRWKISFTFEFTFNAEKLKKTRNINSNV